jgi:hypothetical protein
MYNTNDPLIVSLPYHSVVYPESQGCLKREDRNGQILLKTATRRNELLWPESPCSLYAL